MMVEPLRVCRVCGKKAYSEKELELFEKDSRSKFGRANRCGRCSADKVIIYYRKSPQFSKKRLKDFRAKHPSAHRKDVSEDKQKHPDRHKARKQVYNRRIPLASACAQCGSKENLQHHHPDYSKPLEVITLCQTCHGLVHRIVLEQLQKEA
jgi:hypothetical protein